MRVLHEETETLGLVYFFSWQFRFTRAMRMTHDLIARGTLEKAISRKSLGFALVASLRGSAVGLWKRSGRAVAH